jgi:hypothetical protein
VRRLLADTGRNPWTICRNASVICGSNIVPRRWAIMAIAAV